MNDSMILHVLDGLQDLMDNKFWGADGVSELFLGLAMTLACLFALILIAQILYKPMTGQGSIDILGLAKPLLYALILSNWFIISETMFSFSRPLEEFFRSRYELDVKQVDEKRAERLAAARKLEAKVAQKKSELDTNELVSKPEAEVKDDKLPDRLNEEGAEEVEAEYFDSYNPLDHLLSKAIVEQADTMNWIEKAILWLGEVYWASSIFFVFLCKHIATVVLVLFGPILIAASILWSGSWKRWVGLCISTSMYGAVAFMVMSLCLKIIKYGIQADINLLHNTLQNEMELFSYMKFVAHSGIGTTLMYLIALMCGGTLVLMVPELATWVFPSELFRGAEDFQSGVRNNIKTVAITAVALTAGALTGNLGTGIKAAKQLNGGGGGGLPGAAGGGDFANNGEGGTPPNPDEGDGKHMNGGTKSSSTASSSGSASKASKRSSNASGASQTGKRNDWYDNILSNQSGMEQLRLDLEAYEEAILNGTVDEFMETLSKNHPEWNKNLDELVMGDERDKFWEELKQKDRRKAVLEELDELLNNYDNE